MTHSGPAPSIPDPRRRSHRRLWILVAAGVVAAIGLSVRVQGAAGPYSFPHRPHVGDATIQAGLDAALSAELGRANPGRGLTSGPGGEVDAECRVCHDYENRADDHHLTQQACDRCHIDSQHLTFKLREKVATGRPAFPHKEHLADKSITCFTCHRTQVAEDWVEFTMPDPTLGLGPMGLEGRPGGPAQDFTCTDCHATHYTKQGASPRKVKQTEVTGDGRECAQCHAGRTEIVPYEFRGVGERAGRGAFLHADHVDMGTVATNPQQCDACHQGVRKSETVWDYDPTGGGQGASACASCHMADRDGRESLVVTGPPREIKQVDFSQFPHSKHLAALPGARERGKATADVTKSCVTCHYPELDPAPQAKAVGAALTPPRGGGGPEPIGRAALIDYDGCTPCHEGWAVPGHGVEQWACFKCHEGRVDPATDKLGMRFARVRREKIDSIAFARHAHPGITTAGQPLTGAAAAQAVEGAKKACTDCHLGVSAADLESRLAGMSFDHGPHVNHEPTNADCTVCHSDTVTSRRSTELARFDSHLSGATKREGARACLDCHVGAKPGELGISTPPTPRLVPEFDHAAHLRQSAKWQRSISCTECHTPGGDAGYTTAPEILACVKCHSHKQAEEPQKYDITGPATTGEGQDQLCLKCHETTYGMSTGGEVQAPSWTPRTRRNLELAPDAEARQWHDLSKDCQACHSWDVVPGREIVRYHERTLRAELGLNSIHDDPVFAKEWFNNPRIDGDATVDPQGRTCAYCHVRPPRGYLRNLGNK